MAEGAFVTVQRLHVSGWPPMAPSSCRCPEVSQSPRDSTRGGAGRAEPGAHHPFPRGRQQRAAPRCSFWGETVRLPDSAGVATRGKCCSVNEGVLERVYCVFIHFFKFYFYSKYIKCVLYLSVICAVLFTREKFRLECSFS